MKKIILKNEIKAKKNVIKYFLPSCFVNCTQTIKCFLFCMHIYKPYIIALHKML